MIHQMIQREFYALQYSLNKGLRAPKNPYGVEMGRFISDIHFIWRPANWPDRPKRAPRTFHGFGEYLVGFYGFNARRRSRWFVHSNIHLSRSTVLRINRWLSILLSDLYGGMPHVTALFIYYRSFNVFVYCFFRKSEKSVNLIFEALN